MSNSESSHKGFYWKGHYFCRNDYYGVNGESHVINVLKAVIGRHRLNVLHVDWFNHYNHGDGADFKIVDTEFNVLVEGEVKNWQQQGRPYGTEIIESEVLTRFTTEAPIKLLIITFLSLLTHKALELLKQHGITVIEVGGLMLGEGKSRLFKPLLKKLYSILKPLLTKHNRRRKFVLHNKQGKLTKYFNDNTVTVTPNNKINKTLSNTNNRIYDTNVRNSILNVYLPPNQQPHFKVKRIGSGDFG